MTSIDIINTISKMVNDKKTFEFSDEIITFILQASLNDIKTMFDNFSKYDKMIFRNRVYMSILYDKCEQIKYKITDKDTGTTTIIKKPRFKDTQLEIIEYINSFSGIVDPNIVFNDEIVYAEENQALIAAILSGQA